MKSKYQRIFHAVFLSAFAIFTIAVPLLMLIHQEESYEQKDFINVAKKFSHDVAVATDQLIQDRGLKQSIVEGLQNTTSKWLEASLRPKTIENIVLIDAQCNIISSAALNDALFKKSDCTHDFLLNPNGQQIWLRPQESQELILRTTYQLDLNPQQRLWIATLTGFALSEDLLAKGYVLTLDAHGKPNISRNGFVSEFTRRVTPGFSSYFFVALLGFLTESLLWIGMTRAKVKQTFTPLLIKEDDTEIELIKELRQKTQAEIDAANAETARISDNMRAVEAKNRELSKQLDQLASTQSLATQVGVCIESVHEHLETLRNRSEDLLDVLVHGISAEIRSTQTQWRDLERELNRLGPRHFSRTYVWPSPDPASTELSLFQQFLRNYFQHATKTEDQLLAAIQIAHHCKTKSMSILGLGSHWQDLTEEISLSPTVDAPFECVRSAQQLIEMASNRIRFQNQFELSVALSSEIWRIPKSRFISALFHIYASMNETELADSEMAIVITKISPDANVARALRIQLKIESRRQDTNTISAEKSKSRQRIFGSTHHLHLAQKLLTPYRVRIKENIQLESEAEKDFYSIEVDVSESLMPSGRNAMTSPRHAKTDSINTL